MELLALAVVNHYAAYSTERATKVHTLPGFKFVDPAPYLTEHKNKSRVFDVCKLRHCDMALLGKREIVPTSQDS